MGRADASLNMEWGWEAVRKELQAMAEPDYRAFASGLIPGGTPMLGVRLPALRGLAKRIARGDWCAFRLRGIEYCHLVGTASPSNGGGYHTRKGRDA